MEKKTSSKKRSSAVAAVAVAVPIVVVLLLNPVQELYTEFVVEAVDQQVESQNEPIAVTGQRRAELLRSLSYPEPVDARLAAMGDRPGMQPPEAVEVGMLQSYDPNGRGPRVFEQYLFTLVGQHKEAVIIESIDVRVTYRQEPLSGSISYKAPQGAAPHESIGFDLDSGNTSAREMEENAPAPTETGRMYFDEKRITLTEGEVESFRATVFSRTCRCEFVFDVTTSDGAVVEVNDGGRPFTMSAFSPKYGAAYTYDMTQSPPTIVRCRWPQECITFN